MGDNMDKDTANRFAGWTARGIASAQRRAAETAEAEREPLLPQRVDTITMGEERLMVRRGPGKTEQVSVDDLMLEGLINRALSKQDLRSVEELYRRLDAEELQTLVKPPRKPTARQMEAAKGAAQIITEILSARRAQLLELGVACMDGRTLKVDPDFLAGFRSREL